MVKLCIPFFVQIHYLNTPRTSTTAPLQTGAKGNKNKIEGFREKAKTAFRVSRLSGSSAPLYLFIVFHSDFLQYFVYASVSLISWTTANCSMFALLLLISSIRLHL